MIVPPTEYDPRRRGDAGELVEVGPEGTVDIWAWVPRPRPKHPLRRPFAWVLVRLDGADTSLLHVLDAAGPDEVSTGMRVRPDFVARGRAGRAHQGHQGLRGGGRCVVSRARRR